VFSSEKFPPILRSTGQCKWAMGSTSLDNTTVSDIRISADTSSIPKKLHLANLFLL